MGDTVTLPKSARPEALAISRPRLRVVYSPATGPQPGRVFSLPLGVTWIGRALPADHDGITIDADPALSATHARLEVSPADYRVKIVDCKSKNGTWVGGERCGGEALPLADGEVLRLGGTFLVLRYERAQTPDADVPGLFGISPAIRALRVQLHRLATEPQPLLLHGATGTGKEVVSRALHRLSQRPGELVQVNCAAIPPSLAESELFGHAERAFTDAKPRLGLFRRADRGTLLLDEIGDMPLELQAKLLRVLEERTVTPVGSDRGGPTDVRVIAATHRDLRAESAAGRFRQDLYMRLAQLSVELPPLRVRREDILLLLQHGSPEAAGLLSPDLVHALLTHAWPGNVRELLAAANQLRVNGITDDILERLSPPELGQPALTPSSSSPTSAAPPTPPVAPYRLPTPAKAELERLLYRHLGTVKLVAEEMGCSRRQVQRWLEKYELRADDFRKMLEK